MIGCLNVSVIAVALLLLPGFLDPAPAAAGPRGGGAGRGGGKGGAGCGQAFATRFKEIEKTTLTPTEIEEVLYLREEEKLARDVYHTLGLKWKLRIFSNIKSAEQTHMDHIKMVIDLYDLQDPVVDDSVGVFSNAHLAALYVDLVKKGEKTVVDALQVGMTIEDLDIFDINEMLATATNDHVKIVAYNLVKGSRNHMRSFWKVLVANKGTYAAQFLTQTEIDEIVAGDMERGIVYDENGDPLTAGGGCGDGKGRGKGRGKGGGKGRGKGPGAGNGPRDGSGNGPGDGSGRGRGRGCGPGCGR